MPAVKEVLDHVIDFMRRNNPNTHEVVDDSRTRHARTLSFRDQLLIRFNVRGGKVEVNYVSRPDGAGAYTNPNIRAAQASVQDALLDAAQDRFGFW